jgi:hypothetical protein
MPGLPARAETVYHRPGAGIPRIDADAGDLGFPGVCGKYFVRWRSYLEGMARDMELRLLHYFTAVAEEAPTIDLVLGYHKENNSPLLKLFISRVDNLIDRVSKQVR